MAFFLLTTIFAVILCTTTAYKSNGENKNTPFVPTVGWTYHIEAVHQESWPSCPYRFISHDQTCNAIDMYHTVGINQEWTLIDAGNSSFYLKSSCGGYLSYSGDCSSSVVDQWSQAGVNQAFRFLTEDNTQFQYYIEAIGRSGCSQRYLSFPQSCTSSSPDMIDLWSGKGVNQRFRLFPVRTSTSQPVLQASSGPCADPFVFFSSVDKVYYLQCTGGDLALSQSTVLTAKSYFESIGSSLGGSKPGWASDGQRWAPESFFYNDDVSYVLFSDAQPDGVHRIGWGRSDTGVHNSAWNSYSENFMALENSAGGDIDQNVFFDNASGKHYMVWKSDDNSVGDTVTRIWMCEISVTSDLIEVASTPQVILDSTGLWWIDSWITGGSLIEGPELVKPSGSEYYYLFFASGKYCEDSYAEGVARSKSLWGPYEKMGVPLLSTGAVGSGQATGVAKGKLIGPGHASVEQDAESGQWFLMWHASIGGGCTRYPFTTALFFGADGWPFVELI